MSGGNTLIGELAKRQLQLTSVMESATGVYLIGELAESLGIEPTAIRFYEKSGLIKPKRAGTLRMFEREDVERLAAIVYLRNLNTPMARVKELLEYSTSGSSEACKVLECQLQAVMKNAEFMSQRIQELQTTLMSVQEPD
jgi:DNA-binding transcriptional MerR regulator